MKKLLALALLLLCSSVAFADVTGGVAPPGGAGGGSGCTLANPTASIGLTAANGIATTCFRSDAAQALDQTIAPTWTGLHTFASTEPRIRFDQTGAGTDLKWWDWDVASGVACFRTRTDADGTGQSVFCATRGATTALTNETFGYAVAGTYTFPFTGTATFAGQITANSTIQSSTGTPAVRWNATGQGADLKTWTSQVSGTSWLLVTNTDALGAGKTVLSATRGTTTAVGSLDYGNATDLPKHNFHGPVLLSANTVSTLPTCVAGLTGALQYVTDATSPTYNATLTGGGAVVIPVFCNGSAWTAH